MDRMNKAIVEEDSIVVEFEREPKGIKKIV